MEEEWRPIARHDGYDVSNLGRVRSWKRDGTGITRRGGPRILTGWRQHGYPIVGLQRSDGGRSKVVVHRLVLFAFEGPPPNGTCASHLNGDRADNRLSNLRWETLSQNNRRKEEHGTSQRGEAHGCSKLTSEQVASIRERCKSGQRGTQRAIANEYGLSESQVSSIVLGKSWVGS
jgi:hypothetical protein